MAPFHMAPFSTSTDICWFGQRCVARGPEDERRTATTGSGAARALPSLAAASVCYNSARPVCIYLNISSTTFRSKTAADVLGRWPSATVGVV